MDVMKPNTRSIVVTSDYQGTPLVFFKKLQLRRKKQTYNQNNNHNKL